MGLIEEKPSVDEVLAEVWRIKEELSAKFDFDVRRICEDARQKQATSDREILQPAVSVRRQT